MSKPTCIFQSSMWTRSGYGDWGMAVAKSLLRYDKYDLMLIPTRWGACSRKHLIEEITDPVEKILFGKIVRQPLTKQPELFIHSTIPNEYAAPAKFNIGMTAGIETTVARGDWIDGLNRMNMNMVTSNHAKYVFEQANYMKKGENGAPDAPIKLAKPMEVLFWGADTSVYKKTDVVEPAVEEEMSKIPESFCYLFVGQWTHGGLFSDRKDIGNLIKTFIETFRNKPNKPALIIKTSGAALCNMDKYDMINRLKAIRENMKASMGADLPNVYLMYGELSDKEMNSLYNHPKVKVHISFTHGEGFGHPLLLATLSGKPILVSDWSGHLDFLNPDYAKLLHGEVKKLAPENVNEWLIAESSWFTVDYFKAQEAMWNVFNYYGGFLDKAENLRKENEEKFSIEAMDKKFWTLLEQYVPTFATEQKLILPKLKKITLPKFGPPTEGVSYYSQYNQDKILNDEIFKNKTKGVFVDIGAYDGVLCSNTYFFEKHLDWTGICIEPIPSIYEKLKNNRKCPTINGCAWIENTKKTFRVVEGESDMLSGLVDAYAPEHLERVKRDAQSMSDIQVNCFDINEILKEYNLSNIDLLSLDTEGGELEILKRINWENSDIKTVLVENQYDPAPIRTFMFSKGYRLLNHIVIDDIFVK